MRGKGINYDTGFAPTGSLSRNSFEPEVVREEMRVIAEELHCTAVRISGADPQQIELAAEFAAGYGLEVWFAPFPCNLAADQLLPHFADCARRAEQIRSLGAEVVLVLGCELTIFAAGFLPGEDFSARLSNLTSTDPAVRAGLGDVGARLNDFLARAAATAREHFHGRLSYASGIWEDVDWTPFDLVGVDAYRDADNAPRYQEHLRGNFRHGKPVVVTEFGCCAYRGAGDRGGMGWAIREDGPEGRYVAEQLVRDEDEQVRYLKELLAEFEEAGVDSAFWFTFADFESPHRAEQCHDLDLGSYGVVAMLPAGEGTGAAAGTSWRPKRVFAALAEAYRA
ncbi:hypothetical protein [Kitasatospora kifunensis]|uniref:Abortive infection protein n=1 Tax=Kitasatospora kifunensis TaxID=58351 RepID=A0A7W7R2U6_KITKI|nr:hypothetical protein [Kitasatospora kifunensis]MBB4924393.1 hypothetical protein [Kitasatospora kifunensis]